MKRESIAYLISGTLFGVLVGWIIGSQQAVRVAPAPPPASAAVPNEMPAAPPLDTERAETLRKTAEAQPSNAGVRVELANLFYDAQQYDRAVPWYEAALKLTPKNADVSTDLAFCYFSMGQIERALAQIDQSLVMDPKHVKTLLNQGVIRAFGKSDLRGAADSWQRVIAIAPGSEESKRAQQGLDGIRASHPEVLNSGRGGTR
jgi:tetratricopeptide (TPR) repeat protein